MAIDGLVSMDNLLTETHLLRMWPGMLDNSTERLYNIEFLEAGALLYSLSITNMFCQENLLRIQV